MTEPERRPFRHAGNLCRLGAAVLVLAGGGLWAWHARTALVPPAPRPPDEEVEPAGPAEDPRRTYAGPFRNIGPEVGWTGDEACARCHAGIAASFHRHPMGRSLVPVAAVARSQPGDAAHRNPFEDLHSRFSVELRGDRVWHRQTRLDASGRAICERETEVHYAIGSGTRGRSYLSNRDGYLFQSALSWYSQKQVWDLSPGFRATPVPTRPVGEDCLFCHANRTRFDAESVNRYDAPIFLGEAIGCERCHGPGERHVASSDPLDVVNPARLEPARREAVCEQCHLEGEVRVVRRGRRLDEFRPGLSLRDFVSVFVFHQESPEGRRAVHHVEQMHESRCYRAGRGAARLDCISCHDPHVSVGPGERQSFYRERCLKCHSRHGCSAPPADRRVKGDSCIDCHMPRQGSSDVAHTAVTDHRVLRIPAAAGSLPTPPPLRGLLPVAAFGPSDTAPPAAEGSRDLGLALVAMIQQGNLDRAYADRALPLLEAATRRDPDDVEAWQARADALAILRRPAEALAALESALQRRPRRETLLSRAALLSEAVGDAPSALEHWRRAVAANPWLAEYRAGLAGLLAQRGAWKEARVQCRDWLRLDPESVSARLLWIRCLLHDGERREARAEADRVGLLEPENRARLEAWFQEQTREAPVP